LSCWAENEFAKRNRSESKHPYSKFTAGIGIPRFARNDRFESNYGVTAWRGHRQRMRTSIVVHELMQFPSWASVDWFSRLAWLWCLLVACRSRSGFCLPLCLLVFWRWEPSGCFENCGHEPRKKKSCLMLGVKRDNRNPYHGQWQSLGAEHWVGWLRGCTPRGSDNPYPPRRAASENWRGRYLTTE